MLPKVTKIIWRENIITTIAPNSELKSIRKIVNELLVRNILKNIYFVHQLPSVEKVEELHHHKSIENVSIMPRRNTFFIPN